ncbi:hypothetical protein [Salmonirosea aquatica]|uniref:Uncharacterized protein n=1 Tax=Salmonirosea aquatica TaxID=2654236 RepID=A0A7C9BTJ2_9BACT|nr:hypothetical protein [Cytophagaceae bacterium SJW1-29]
MKNKAGILSGFVLGTGGFLLLFKLLILDRTDPSDELAPGIVVFMAVLSGFLFAYLGSRIQNARAK